MFLKHLSLYFFFENKNGVEYPNKSILFLEDYYAKLFLIRQKQHCCLKFKYDFHTILFYFFSPYGAFGDNVAIGM